MILAAAGFFRLSLPGTESEVSMSRRTAFFLFVLLIFAIAQIAVAARLVSVSTCTQVQEPGTIPLGIAESFTPETPAIHAVVVMEELETGTKITGQWVAVSAAGVTNHPIDAAEVEAPAADARIHFSVSKPNDGWPVGEYRLDIYVRDKLATSVPFVVSSTSPAQAESTPAESHRILGAKPKPSGGLVGCWNCQSAEGTSQLDFREGNQVAVDGELFGYTLSGSTIRLQDDYGYEEYQYALSGDNLTITFPDGFVYQCARSTQPCGGQPYGEEVYDQGASVPTYPGQVPPAVTGNEAMLQGWFCSYGSSRSYTGSSYSHSNRVHFDGQGGFSTTREQSYSGDPGIAYGQYGDEGGRYHIEGNNVILQFNDGSSGTATVYNRDGQRITELMYGGELYAPQLCE